MAHRKSPPHSPLRDRELLFGSHAVLAALANPLRQVMRLWASDNAARRHAGAIGASGQACEPASQRQIAAIVGAQAVHQGLVAEVRPLPPFELDQLTGSGPLVVLDQVSDPHNVGAILRSCAALGAEALVMTARNAPPLTGTVAKAASGAVEHVPVIRVTNLARALGQLADLNYQIIGLDGSAEAALEELDFAPPVALLLGAEGKGLRELTRRHCDYLARLPTGGPIASLNVSNAAALALYIASSRSRM
jgi:23S rRNA (guanosine2251-2'-O)-methyltransferase